MTWEEKAERIVGNIGRGEAGMSVSHGLGEESKEQSGKQRSLPELPGKVQKYRDPRVWSH